MGSIFLIWTRLFLIINCVGGADLSSFFSRRSVLIYFMLCAVCMAVPWFVPVSPAISDSYVWGYSNRTFILSFGFLFVLPLLAHGCFRRRKFHGVAAGLMAPHFKGRTRVGKSMLWVPVLLLSLAVIFLMIAARQLSGYGESEYFLLRAALARAGWRPYQDFEYAYGPGLLYAINWLVAAGMSPGFSEALLVVIGAFAGYFSIFYISLRIFENKRAAILVALGFVVVTSIYVAVGGQNYTFLRFAGPVAFSVGLLEFCKNRGVRGGVLGLLVGPVFVVGWVFSPEVGLAAASGFGVMAIVCARKPLWSVGCVSLSLGAVIASIPLLRSSLATMAEFSKGGNNFPILPSPYIILFLLAVFLSVVYVTQFPMRQRPLEWCLLFISLCLLPGAFGRSDAGHVVFYGFGFFILGSKAALELKGRWLNFRIFSLSWVICFFVGCTLPYALFGSGQMVGVVTRGLLDYFGWNHKDALLAKVPPRFQEKARHLLDPDVGGRIFASLDRRSLIINPRSDFSNFEELKFSYFVTLHNAATLTAFERIYRDVGGGLVSISRAVLDAKCSAYRPGWGESVILMFPTALLPIRHQTTDVTSAFCDRLVGGEVLHRGDAEEFDLINLRANHLPVE